MKDKIIEISIDWFITQVKDAYVTGCITKTPRLVERYARSIYLETMGLHRTIKNIDSHGGGIECITECAFKENNICTWWTVCAERTIDLDALKKSQDANIKRIKENNAEI